MTDQPRCWDCLTDFVPGARTFAVLKQTFDAPEEMFGRINDPKDDDIDARLARAMLFSPVLVCEECAGWYGDHPIEVEHL